AVLVAADFTGACNFSCSFRFANLSRARLIGADLRGADLSFANLSGANLRDAIYDETTIWRGARYNQRTRWVEGARRPAPL
ncbi:MAG TPA: pentapeptide repeat-containing protein, partial [Acidimicrobiales bacterium]|nr:pentapeptide repeat-containing protein [Acidimicrobiales bacterium]